MSKKKKIQLWQAFSSSFSHKVSKLWQFADKLCPISYPKGIFKFRRIEEANKQRNEWEMQHAKKNTVGKKFNNPTSLPIYPFSVASILRSTTKDELRRVNREHRQESS